MSKRVWAGLVVLVVAVVVIVGFIWQASGQKDNKKTTTEAMSQMQMSSSMVMSSSMSGMNMSSMTMDDSLPTNLSTASQAKYAVGSKITLEADHMAGMKGAKGTVAGVYDAQLYEVNYQPTTGGHMVTGHKWLTKADFSDMMDHKVGDMVTITSNHMAGMEGASATITKVVAGPAYVVNYQPTTGGKMVMNHKYLIESEIKAR